MRESEEYKKLKEELTLIVIGCYQDGFNKLAGDRIEHEKIVENILAHVHEWNNTWRFKE